MFNIHNDFLLLFKCIYSNFNACYITVLCFMLIINILLLMCMDRSEVF